MIYKEVVNLQIELKTIRKFNLSSVMTKGLRLFWSCCFLKKRKNMKFFRTTWIFFLKPIPLILITGEIEKKPMKLILHMGNWPAVRNPEKYLTFKSQDPSDNSPYWLLYISCKLDQRIWCCITIAPLKLISSSVLWTCLQNNLLELW